jgi:importin-9
VPQNLVDLSADRASNNEPKPQNIVDSSILMHVIDLLSTLLKKTKDKTLPDFHKIIDVFPKLLEYVNKSEDMFLLLHGTSALRTFIHLGHEQILKICPAKDMIEVAKKLLSPTTNEQAAMQLGNYVIQIIHKIEPKIDTNLLMCVVWKIYKSRMPSIVQSLVLIFARLIHVHPKAIVEFLSETSIDNRISLKIVLDKWLLQ